MVCGFIGIVFGIVGNIIIYKVTSLYIPVAFYSIVIAFVFSALIGVVF
jgi:putative ABC transport system permease protein